MKVLLILFVFIFSIINYVEANSKENNLGELSVEDDPEEYVLDYFPLTVGNYWKMIHFSQLTEGELTRVGEYQKRVVNLMYYEIYFGEELLVTPVYTIQNKYIEYETQDTSINFQYAVETSEGVLVSNKEPLDSTIVPYIFIPDGWSDDIIAQKITGNIIERKVKVDSPFGKMTCMKIQVMQGDRSGSLLFKSGQGHVMSLLYDDYPKNTTYINHHIVLSEYIIQ
ncbi:MAG: hypothetical protein ACE364_05175 [Chlorobiota bacterium]